ncbi:MAG: AmmeMemoRadiSam system protein B [Planctomycetota bacterium]|jgi:AmmeMemoRadiSam system protein B/AmmeMemoRadiSam system protein A
MPEQSSNLMRGPIRLRQGILLLCVLGLFPVISCRKETPAPEQEALEPQAKAISEPMPKSVLRSQLARVGWYTARPDALNRQIEELFEKAQVEPIENVVALILPHAGYSYSGSIAAKGLKTTDRKYKRIVVIGPSHSVPMEEILSVPRVTHYETPLGEVPLDVEFINKLLEYSVFRNVPQAHELGRRGQEHSVQIELPLLQHSRTDFKFVPIVAGQCSHETITKAGKILRSLVDQDTLVIASSDFVHYGPSFGYVPFDKDLREQIRKLDIGAYEHIERLDCKGFLDYKQRTRATICGYVPVAVLLAMLGEPTEAKLIEYATSGEMGGDFTNSVSYLSIAFSGTWSDHAPVEPQTNDPNLTESDRKQLLALARRTMDFCLERRRIPDASELGVAISDAMRCPRAAFVTLRKEHVLRGCIGDIFPQKPLYKSVIQNAINACFNDTRFPQVSKDECKDITIEISALTAPAPVASADEIRIGTDGVVLNKDGHSAVFLPQVATEQGWDIDQTLTQLSLKAQLPGDAWKQGAGFLVFQADVFGESEK